MLGSSISVSGPNIVLNTAVAESLAQFYEELKTIPAEEMETAVYALVKKTILAHKKIIFNGNGYTDEWVAEAEKRGLYNLKSTPEALPCFIADKNVELFTKHHVFTEGEIHSRYEILLEEYCKTLHIEAKTLSDIVKKQFLPSLLSYSDSLATTIAKKKDVAGLACACETRLLQKLAGYYEKIYGQEEILEESVKIAEGTEDTLAQASYYHENIIPVMEELRSYADAAEEYIPDELLPYPTYEKLLFSI